MRTASTSGEVPGSSTPRVTWSVSRPGATRGCPSIASTSPPCAGPGSPIRCSATSAMTSSTPSATGCTAANVTETADGLSRPDAAGALAVDCALVTEILTGFVREEVRKVGFERGVIGLSGGIDSALTLAVVCRALGPENAIPVIMPYRASSPASERDARLVATQLGTTPLVVDISPQIDAYFDRNPDADRNRRGNKMARERMSILYDLSLARAALVVGTSNKTELLLGYGTIHGDMAHALNPLGDLYKTQIFALARYLGLPAAVIEKAPSADLWAG